MFISSPVGVLRTSSVKLRYKSLKVFQPFCSPILRSRSIIDSVVLWFEYILFSCLYYKSGKLWKDEIIHTCIMCSTKGTRADCGNSVPCKCDLVNTPSHDGPIIQCAFLPLSWSYHHVGTYPPNKKTCVYRISEYPIPFYTFSSFLFLPNKICSPLLKNSAHPPLIFPNLIAKFATQKKTPPKAFPKKNITHLRKGTSCTSSIS